MNLVLCGMMGSGKTTVGRALAKALCWKFADTDEILTEEYGAITDLFANYGEDYFREKESKVCAQFKKEDSLVLSIGGGTLLREENVCVLKSTGKIIFLRAKKETLLKRLYGNQERPLLQLSENLEEKIEEFLKIRTPIYLSSADYIVDVDGKTPEEIAQEIIKNARGGIAGMR